MGIDAVALIHCTRQDLLAKLATSPLGDDFAEQLKRLTAAAHRGEDLPLAVSLSVLGVRADFAKIFTGVRFRELQSDRVFAQMLAHRILEVLPGGVHEDERVLFYPDAAEPFAETYAEVIAELAEVGVWASTAAVAPEIRRAWQQAKMNEVAVAVEGAPAMMTNAAADPQKLFADRMKAAGDAILDKLAALSRKQPSSPEDLADSNRKLLDRIRKMGTPEQVKQWEQALGVQATQPADDTKDDAKVKKRRPKKKPKKA